MWPFPGKASLNLFFNLYGDSRGEARRILVEYCVTPFQVLRGAELYQQLNDLYMATVVPVEAMHFKLVFVDAFRSALYLLDANILLPGTEVIGGNPTMHSDSPMTTSINSNQQESTSGADVHAEQAEVESSSSMSYIPARTLFESNDGSSNDTDSNANLSVTADPN